MMAMYIWLQLYLFKCYFFDKKIVVKTKHIKWDFKLFLTTTLKMIKNPCGILTVYLWDFGKEHNYFIYKNYICWKWWQLFAFSFYIWVPKNWRNIVGRKAKLKRKKWRQSDAKKRKDWSMETYYKRGKNKKKRENDVVYQVINCKRNVTDILGFLKMLFMLTKQQNFLLVYTKIKLYGCATNI